MRSSTGLPRSKASLGAADHEGQRRRLGAADAARDRRVERGDAALGREPMRLARARHVDGRAIDEQRALVRGRQHILPHRQDMLAGRQHGNDDIGVFNTALGIGHDLHTIAGGRFARGRHDVEAAHMLAAFDQIGRHGSAHVSKTDESDIRHVRSPST